MVVGEWLAKSALDLEVLVLIPAPSKLISLEPVKLKLFSVSALRNNNIIWGKKLALSGPLEF